MTEEPKIALFDLDGSLAAFEDTLLNDLQKIHGPNDVILTKSGMWDLEDIPYMKERMNLIKRVPGWWRKLPIIENGIKILKASQKMGFENHILTKGPKTNSIAWKEKVEWCADNLGNLVDSVNIVTHKGLVYGTFLYDDYPPYMSSWLKYRPRGLGIMPVTEYNQGFEHPQVIQWTGDNFNEVIDVMQKAYDRKSKQNL